MAGTGRSVVIDATTGEIIHVGGDGFQYEGVSSIAPRRPSDARL
jgi:DNA/RNA endonuclease YhcR with UshA esterase domain